MLITASVNIYQTNKEKKKYYNSNSENMLFWMKTDETIWKQIVSWPWFTLRGKFWLFNILDHWKMAFPHLKGKPTFLEKISKWNSLFFKKSLKVVHFTDFFLCECSMYSHFEFELKNKNTILMVSKIQTNRELIIQLKSLPQGTFLL